MFLAIVVFSGILFGPVIAHYTAYLINKNEDCTEPVIHKLFSIRTGIISIINGLLWLAVCIFYDNILYMIIYIVAMSVLLCISIVDLAVYEIPIQFNIILLAEGIVICALDYKNWLLYLVGSVLVSGLFLIIALITKGKGMGGGDIKLMFTCGLMLGWKKIFFVMFIGALLGSVIHISLMKISKKEKVLAFGPYLSVAVAFMICYGDQIVKWYVDTFLTFNNI